jgi:hypothetical protein
LRGALSLLFVGAGNIPEAILDAWASSDFAKQNRDQPSVEDTLEFPDSSVAIKARG